MRTLLIYILVAIVGLLRVTQETQSLQRMVEYGEVSNTELRLIQLQVKALEWRDALEEGLAAHGLSEASYALTAAMTLGDRGGITPDVRDAYSRTGASHALAISGMHLSVVYMLLIALIFWLPRFILALPELLCEVVASHYSQRTGNRILPPRFAFVYRLVSMHRSHLWLRRILMLVAVAFLWGYVLLAGMAPSLIRAATMLTIVSIGMMMWRHVRLFDSLVLAAFIILVVSPLSFYDVGFQMSFLAVLGISIYNAPLDEMLERVVRWKWLRVCLCIAFSAQLLVTPLIAHYFSRISAFSLLLSPVVSVAATLIVWLGVIILILSACTMMTGVTFPEFVYSCFAVPLQYVSETQNAILQYISSLPYASMDGISVSTAQVVLIYIVIACVTIMISLYRKQS